MKLKIFGREYNIKGDVSPEYLKELSDYLNEQMDELSRLAPGKSAIDIATLTALNIADELLQERRTTETHITRAKKASYLLDEVMTSLKEAK